MKMDIIIKNVTGKIENDYYIAELRRCGFPAGSLVRNVEYRPTNNSCCWSSGTDDCGAYIGQTCAVKATYFKEEIACEHGGTGYNDSSFEIFFDYENDDNSPATILWYQEHDCGMFYNSEHIDLWFENRTLTRFEGVSSLPEQAKQLIRLNGLRVPDEF